MHILVTGATGFVGRHFLPKLLRATKAKITILLRRSSDSQSEIPTAFKAFSARLSYVHADLQDGRQTARAVQQVRPDAVVHLAAVGVTDPFLDVEFALRHNVIGTVNLLNACFQPPSPVKQFIVARTPGEHSAMNTYAASKAAAWSFCEMFARTRRWPIHGAMIFQAYGTFQPAHTLVQAALAAALAGQDFPMTSGEQRKDWIHIDDVAEALVAMLGASLRPGITLDIATGEETSVAEVVELIYQMTNRGGRPLLGALPDRPGEAPGQRADIARTESLLGWTASIPLRGGLARLVSEGTR